MFKKPYFAAVAATLGCSATLASNTLEEVIVSATQTEKPLSEVLASASLISREDIVRLQPIDLTDLLSRQAGIDLTRSGGRGAASTVRLRGANDDHTLILLNGQRISSATLGGTQFQFIDPEQVERIEIVRGSRSALYGSDAIGGVMQIFTKQGGEQPSSYIKTEVGSNAFWKAAAGANGTVREFRYGVGASYLETVGIDNRVDDSGFNGDRDGYKNDSFNGSLGYSFANGADISLAYFQANSRNEYDNNFNPLARPYSESTLSSAIVSVEAPVMEYWVTRLALGNSVDDTDNFDEAGNALQSHFRSTRDSVYWQNDFNLYKDQTLTLGVDYYDAQITTSTAHQDTSGNPVNSRDNTAVFGQFQASMGAFDMVLGIREDDNEAFGTYTTGNISVGYSLNDVHKVVLSWAEGFKAPTFNDLYWPAGPFSAGNPDVIPEESENYEVSIRGNYTDWHWSFAVYRNKIDNLIDWAPGADFVWRPYNVAAAKITGGELMTEFQVAGWAVMASASYTDPEDESTGETLSSRAKKKFAFDISRNFQHWQLGFTAQVQSERAVDVGGKLPGYGVIGVYVGAEIADNLTLQLKLDNLLDKDYQLNEGYNEDGVNGLLSATYTF